MTYSTPLRWIIASLLASACYPALAQSAPDIEEMDEIIVTGSPLLRSVDDAITGQSILTGDELSNRLAATIGETLKTEPGVSSSFFGAGASRPIIRGQGGDRVRVLTNGIGSIDASSASPDHAVAAEAAQAKRIEVLRGASVLRYGSSGAGGVVNVIDGRIPDSLIDGDISGAVRIGASSVDAGHEAAGSLNVPLGAKLVLHVDGTFRKTDDYDIPGFAESAAFRAAEEAEHEDEDDHDEDEDEDHHDEDEHEEEEAEARDRLENSAVDTRSYTAGLSYIGDRGYIGAAFHSFESDYGIPGGHGHEEEGHGHDDEDEDDHEDEDEDHHEEEEGEEAVTIGLEQTRFDINGALELDGFFERVQIFAGIADYKHTEFEGPGVVGTVFTNEGYEVRAEAIQAENNGWAAAYGLQIRQRDFEAVGEEAFVPATRTDQIGLFTFQEKEIGDFHWEGAARFEQTDQGVSGTNASRDFNTVSVSTGGDYHLTPAVRLGGTVYRTQRAPTTEELFSNGPHLATEQFERGNADLDIETATGIEAAIRHRKDGHFVTANLFYTQYDDYIFERETGMEEDGLPIFQYTAEDATFKGFELHGGSELGSFAGYDIEIDALAEYVQAETDSQNLPRIPPLSIMAGLEAQSDRLRLRAELDYAAKAKDLGPLELPTDAFLQTNLFLNWKAPMGAQDVRLNFAVMNLFDEEARQHASFLKDAVPLPGRNVKFSLTSRF